MWEKISIIVVINLLLYFKSLRFKFVSDDFSVWKNPPKFKNRWHRRWLQFMGQAKLQSVAYRIVWRDRRLKLEKYLSEEQEHLLTLLIHAAICVLIYLAFGRSDVSFLAALLYAINPVNNQGSVWPGGRGYTLPLAGLLTAMAFPWLAPLGLFACAWFTAGFLAPLALVGSTKWALLILVPVVWLICLKKFKTAVKTKRAAETFTEDKRVHPRKLVLAIKTFGFYLALCVFPFKITFYHNFLQSAAGNVIMRARAYSLCKFFWIGLASIVGWVICAYHNWSPIAWGFLWFSIAIAPYSNLARSNQEIGERFAYIANVGLMFALANVIISYPLAIVAFLVLYATRTYYTMGMYTDEYWITEYAVVEDPKAWWAWHCRGMKRWDTQSYREALILWVMASLISPKEFKILMNIATVLRILKKDKEADQYLKRASENIVEGQEEESYRFIAEHRKGKLPILL